MFGPRLLRVRRLAVGLAVIALALTPPAGAQTTEQELDEARAQVQALQQRIEAGEAEMGRLKQRLESLSAQVAREHAELGEIRTELARTVERLEVTKARLDRLRNRIRDRARTVYMHGPIQLIGLVLGADSLSDLTGRVAYASRLAAEDNRIMLEVRAAEAQLRDQQAQQEQLEAEQRSRLDTVSSQRAAVRSTIARQLAEVTSLAQARAEAQSLVAQLQDRLASELGGLRDAAGRGMTISYGQWAQEFLGALGAPVSRNNLVVVVAWEVAESTQATWNPLATTMRWEGATVFNSHGVRNYPSKEDGIAATIATLRLSGHGYDRIVASLHASAEPMETGRAIQASNWCRGCAGGTYVIGLIPAVEEYYDQYAAR